MGIGRGEQLLSIAFPVTVYLAIEDPFMLGTLAVMVGVTVALAMVLIRFVQYDQR